MRLQRLNVINKEIKPFEKEFYNSLNLTNLPQGDLQLNCGALAQRTIVQGVIAWRVIFREAIGIGGNCPGSECVGGAWHGGNRIVLEPLITAASKVYIKVILSLIY